jgi:tetratricopeptide (TPR) repeat protein
MQDREKEKAAMADAAKAYQVYHEKGGELPENLGEPGVLYLIGDLHRRLGDYKEARRFYERALATKEIKSFPRIAEMTRDMMHIAKEMMEKTEN